MHDPGKIVTGRLGIRAVIEVLFFKENGAIQY